MATRSSLVFIILIVVFSSVVPEFVKPKSAVEIAEDKNAQNDLVEGDMIFTPEQKLVSEDFRKDEKKGRLPEQQRGKRAIYTLAHPWKYNVIPYDFAENLDDKARMVIFKAMDFWEKHTCIRFAGNLNLNNRVRFIRGYGCSSYVGLVNIGAQTITIGKECETVGLVAHEIGHALGLVHTQARPDRNAYIRINRTNIFKDSRKQYATLPLSAVQTYGVPYDVSSIMHYPPFANGIDVNVRTIDSVDPNYSHSIGGLLPSFHDVTLVNEYYNCSENCSVEFQAEKCQHGGIQDYSNCSVGRCRCPPGWGGTFCETRAPGCGRIIQVIRAPVNVTLDELKGSRDPTAEDYAKCNYIFEARGFAKIKMRVVFVSQKSICRQSCENGGVMIMAKKSYRDSGYRFCCPSQTQYITAETNMVPVVMYGGSTTVKPTLEVVGGFYRMKFNAKIQ